MVSLTVGNKLVWVSKWLNAAAVSIRRFCAATLVRTVVDFFNDVVAME